MATTYKGKAEELSSLSFLAKDCINPEYIKQVSNIFKILYNQVIEKHYGDLYMNGNIVNKVIQGVVTLFNSNKKIKIHGIFENILRDLYISGYNYCVLGYHEKLEAYFDDEKPKNSD